MANKAISVATIIEKNQISSGVAFIVLARVEIFDSVTQTYPETVYVANNAENVVFEGETYVAFPFNVDLKYEAGSIPQISLTAKDYQKVLLAKLDLYSGAIGSRVTITVVNTGNLSQGSEVEEIFEVIGSGANDWSITLQLGAESAIAKNFPTRTQMRDRCSWRYKGPECTYSGAMPTCDLSLQGTNGCAAHSNSENFGGFPSLVNRGIRY